METGFAKAFRIIVFTLACIQYGLLAAGLLYALYVEATGGMGDMPFHLIGAIFAAVAAVTGLVPGFITYAISAYSGEPRKVAFTWGTLAALLGPALVVAVWVSVPYQSLPRWVCAVIGAVAGFALTLVIRAAATPRGRV